jgi:hypothetical protein
VDVRVDVGEAVAEHIAVDVGEHVAVNAAVGTVVGVDAVVGLLFAQLKTKNKAKTDAHRNKTIFFIAFSSRFLFCRFLPA